MSRINNVIYPVLSVTGYQNIPDSPLMKPYYKNASPETLDPETRDFIMSQPEAKEMVASGIKPIVSILKDAKMEGRLPFLAIDRRDREHWGNEKTHMIIQSMNTFWQFWYYDKPVEIVPGYMWDDAFYNAPEGFDEWLESKAKNGFECSGILVRPKEELTEMFHISYDGNDEKAWLETSTCLHRNKVVWHHMNFTGCLSGEMAVTKGIRDLARVRHCSPTEAMFQEDMYNILKYLYYKEYYMLKPTSLVRGDRLELQDGIYEMYTDTPCIMYGVDTRS